MFAKLVSDTEAAVQRGVQHPKFEKLFQVVRDHFANTQGESTRIMVFSSYRFVFSPIRFSVL